MSNSGSNGIGLGTLLFLVFLVLKLTGFVDWSWWWVTAPLWISAALCLAVAGITGAIWLLFTTKKDRARERNRRALVDAMRRYR